MNNLRNFSKK